MAPGAGVAMAMLAVKVAESPAESSKARFMPMFSNTAGPEAPGIEGTSPNDSPAKVPLRKLDAEPLVAVSSVPTTVPSSGSMVSESTIAE